MYDILGGTGGVAEECHGLGILGLVINMVHEKFEATTLEVRAFSFRQLQLKP